MKTTKNNVWSWLAAASLASMVMGCQPEQFGDGNGLSDENLAASFSVTPVPNAVNKYLLQAETEGVLGVKWDLGDGAGAFIGDAVDTVFYPDAGQYTITLMAIGKGGVIASTTKTVDVATSDPKAGNLVVGGKMNDDDASKWQFVTYSQGVTMALVDGKMLTTGGGWGQAGIYQTIQVEAGKSYKIDMSVSGSGATNMWFEVYVGMAAPVAGSDYTDGGIRMGLNTWAGCGNSPFNGKLSTVSCKTTDGGIVSFPTSGTAYLVIRCGGENLGDTGISFDNVELRGVN